MGGEKMSKNLQFLLERIQPPEVKPIDRPVPMSTELSTLLNRVDNRKWQKAELIRILHNLQELQQELEIFKHIRKCEQCQVELQLSVERYMGTRGPWWINLQNEIGFPEIYEEEEGIYKTCPRPQNYKIGCYTHSSEDTIRFIMDRMTWAEKIIKADAETLVDYYIAFEDWNLKSQAPIDTTNLIYY